MPRTRIAVLARLLGDVTEQYYLRELARACGIPLRAAQRELALYEEIGLVSRVPRGRQVFFRVHPAHPLFGELRALVVKAGETLDLAPTPIARDGAPAGDEALPAAFDGTPSAPDDSWRVW